MAHELRLLRVYDLTPETDGYRVLVDRLWPRGLCKETLRLNCWAKEVSPSPELRRWFGHQEDRFDAFAAAYRAELDNSPKAAAFAGELVETLKGQDVLLLYGAKSPTCNHAIILRGWLLKNMNGGKQNDKDHI